MAKNDWLWIVGVVGVIAVGYYLYTNPPILAGVRGRVGGPTIPSPVVDTGNPHYEPPAPPGPMY